MSQNEYELTNEELLDAFLQAVARAGVSNSGLVFDAMAGHERAEAAYLNGVVLSRLDGVKPPFSRGAQVAPKEAASVPVLSVNRGRHGHRVYIGPEKKGKYTVNRVVYEGNAKWSLYFKEVEEYRYPAEHFKAVSASSAQAA